MVLNPKSKPILLRLPEVIKLTGLSRSAVYAMASSGIFPRPIKIGPRASAWLEREVIDWIEARIANSRSIDSTIIFQTDPEV
ncbi:helix-turn-helix transcriptional regulator [Haliea sp.]